MNSAALRTRRQASLFLDGFPHLEKLRRDFNPAQARLIPAHLTLCREDEVDDWDRLQARILSLLPIQLELEFGLPVREGNFVYLPIRSGAAAWDELRYRLLDCGNGPPRNQLPHLTLIHPRNGICTDQALAAIQRECEVFSTTFRSIRIIEQTGELPWQTIFEAGMPVENGRTPD